MSLAPDIPIFDFDDSASVVPGGNSLMSSIWMRFIRSTSYEFIEKQEALDILHLALAPRGSCDLTIVEQIFKSLIDRKCISIYKNRCYRIVNFPTATIPHNNIQGVFVPLSSCYAPRCTKKYPCYSPTCPNKKSPGQLQLARSDSDMLQAMPNGVSRGTFLGLPSKERKRQSAITEILTSEQQYYQDLDILQTIYAQPLLDSSSVIEQTRRKKFHKTVFSNHRSIRELHHQGYQELLEKQNPSNHLFDDRVGTTIYNHVSRLMDPYVTYAANHVQAAYVVTVESNKSTRFEEFLETQNANECTRRLGLRHYLTLPTLRVGKYTLLIQALYKYTTDEADQLTLGAAIAELRDILERMNEATRQSEVQTRRLRIASTLLIPGHVPTSLKHILSDHSALIHEGRLLLARSLHSFTTIPCHVFLFTHMVVVTRPRVSGKHEEFEVACAPIPLYMLRIDLPRFYSGPTTGPARIPPVHDNNNPNGTITGLHIRTRLRGFRQSLRHQKVAEQTNNHVNTMLRRSTGPPRLNHRLRMLTLSHLGKAECTFHLACSSTEERELWCEQLWIAMENAKIKHSPFGMNPLCEVATGSRQPPITVGGSAMFPTGSGRITCTLAFDQVDGQAMLALGTQYGVWVGPRDGGSQDFWLAVAHDDCQQLAILDNVILLVRNRRGALIAYDLEQVCQPHLVGGANKTGVHKQHRWGYICRSSVVSFAVGNIHHSPVLVYLTVSRTSNVLVLLEYRTEWFRKLKEYRLGSRDACHVQIMYNAIFVQSPTMGICRVDGPRTIWKSTCSDILGFVPFTSHAGFVYGPQTAYCIMFESALPMDNIQPKIEFESRLQRVAIIYPYLIGFSPSVMEVRHMHSGKTAQVLTGNHIRCVHVSHTDKAYPTIHASILHHEEHVTRVYSLIPQYYT